MQGRTLTQIVEQLEAEQAVKRDIIVDTRALTVTPDDNGALEMNLDDRGFALTDVAERQIIERVKIPKPYFDRMLELDPDFAAYNINRWLKDKPERRLLRTFDDDNPRIRAFLSDRFRPRDNYELMLDIIPKLGSRHVDFKSLELTDKRLYVKAVFPDVQADILDHVGDIGWNGGHFGTVENALAIAEREGQAVSPSDPPRLDKDIVQAGIIISNSEVGHGAVRVEPFIHRLICWNGLIVSAEGLKAHHVGRRIELLDEAQSQPFYKDATRAAEDKAFFLKVGDTIDASLSEDLFNGLVKRFAQSKMNPIDKPEDAVEDVTNRLNLVEKESQGVLRNLLMSGEFNDFGMVNAITRTAQDVEYDRGVELERAAWSIVDAA